MGALGAAALASCAPKAEVTPEQVIVKETVVVEGETEVVEKIVTVEAPQKEPVTLRASIAFTQSDYGLQYQIIQQWRDLFQQSYPWITADLEFIDWTEAQTKPVVQAAAGELPDFLEVHFQRAQMWVKEGILLPVDPYTDVDPDYDLGDYFPEALAIYQDDAGKTYSCPYDHGPTVLGYNKTMFDEYGEAYPDETWTMDTLLEKAALFTDEDKGTFGYRIDWLEEGSHLMPWGGRLVNDDETECLLTMPESIEAVQWWVDLRLKHHYAPMPAQSEVLSALGGVFESGKVAIISTEPWMAPTYNALADFDWDVAPWPEGPVTRSTWGGGSGYSMGKDTQHPDEAWLFLRWMTSSEGLSFVWAASGASLPPRKSVFEVYKTAPGVPEHVQVFYDAMDQYMVVGRPIQPQAPAFLDIYNREMEFIWTEAKSVEEAAADLKKDADPILALNAS